MIAFASLANRLRRRKRISQSGMQKIELTKRSIQRSTRRKLPVEQITNNY